jgi:hypothetical protein
MCTHRPNCRKYFKERTMAQDPRTVPDRIARLRKRLDELHSTDPLVPILKGILDLLADEL